MFLSNYIGENIFVSLRKGSEQNAVLNHFFDTDSILYVKLMDVDELGIWLEGFGIMVKLIDEAGEEIPEDKQTTEKRTTSVLVRWEYIDDVYVINQEEKKEIPLGFRFNPGKNGKSGKKEK